MDKEFVPYNLALKLKEIGFDEPCMSFFFGDGVAFKWYEKPFNYNKSNDISRPTFSQIFRWFREKHKIITEITFYNNGETWEDTEFKATVTRFEDFATHNTFVKIDIKSYEDAELYCLEKLIEILENK